jgi:hypothetical protein
VLVGVSVFVGVIVGVLVLVGVGVGVVQGPKLLISIEYPPIDMIESEHAHI